jgi:hypothetical protein
VNTQNFILQPFVGDEPLISLSISGVVGRQAHMFFIDYRIVGRLGHLDIPDGGGEPLRKHGLWEGTCLELFLAGRGAYSYREFNLSPDGCWNVYHFNAYRQGMREEEAVTELPFSIRREQSLLQVSLGFDLRAICMANGSLDVGVSGIVRDRFGDVRYYALMHPSSNPDFHRRESFALRL